MRYVLWRVSNGWLLTRRECLAIDEVSSYAIFPTLDAFAQWSDAQRSIKELAIEAAKSRKRLSPRPVSNAATRK